MQSMMMYDTMRLALNLSSLHTKIIQENVIIHDIFVNFRIQHGQIS